MKKLFFGLALVLSVMMVLSCSSLKTQSQIDNAFQRVYSKYQGDLILEGAKHYTVVGGDTLSRISQTNYQNEFHFPLIMLASNEVVKDPDQITPGMQLTIPDLQRNMNNARTKSRLKDYYVEISKIYDKRDRAQAANSLRDLAATM